jgi:hypothetical protein
LRCHGFLAAASGHCFGAGFSVISESVEIGAGRAIPGCGRRNRVRT